MRKNDTRLEQAPNVTPEQLRAIRAEYGQSLAQFGVTLRRTLKPNVGTGFSREYVRQLEVGKKPITGKLARAALILGAMIDGVDEVWARARPVEVLAMNDIAGALVTGEARRCCLAGWWNCFSPKTHRRKYQARACRSE